MRARLEAKLADALKERDDLRAAAGSVAARLAAAEQRVAEYEEILDAGRDAEAGPKRSRATKETQKKRRAAILAVMRRAPTPMAVSEVHRQVEHILGATAGTQRHTADILRRDAEYEQTSKGYWQLVANERGRSLG